ncbi:DUF1349 domain-containing protein [Cohnella boryungensis]|uniref:DUF1349 domain-containing protein n=1 Tax=Cohnella boryungensis TaxID=768479 RepID=A0ABV8SAC1_9BACL
MSEQDGQLGMDSNSGWQWLNEPKQWERSGSDSLTVRTSGMTDFFRDPSGETNKASAPFLFRKIRGDFDYVTRVAVEMKRQYDSGCLMVMADEAHWAKVCYEYFENKPSILSVVTRGHSDDCVSGEAGSDNPYLRIVKAGNCFAFYYSLDGERWKLVRYFGLACGEEIKVGFVAQSPIGEGCKVTFDRFSLSKWTSGDVRNVNPS